MNNTPGIAISNPARCRAQNRTTSNRVNSSSVFPQLDAGKSGIKRTPQGCFLCERLESTG
eukprot:3214406-Lingulodinium_polyedra.AAC.1